MGLPINVIISCSFAIKSEAWETVFWVFFPHSLASPWFLKFWVAAVTPDPHPNTLGQPPDPWDKTQVVSAELTAAGLSSSEGRVSVCILSSLWLSSCDRIRGWGVGSEKGSTTLPRSNSVADKGSG